VMPGPPSTVYSANGDTKNTDMPSHHPRRWSHLVWQIVEVFLAETVGTGMLLFFGCMGQVNFLPDIDPHPLQGAVVFAVVVATIIQIFGHISNAHLNPAVTIAFLMLGQVTAPMALVYVSPRCPERCWATDCSGC